VLVARKGGIKLFTCEGGKQPIRSILDSYQLIGQEAGGEGKNVGRKGNGEVFNSFGSEADEGS